VLSAWPSPVCCSFTARCRVWAGCAAARSRSSAPCSTRSRPKARSSCRLTRPATPIPPPGQTHRSRRAGGPRSVSTCRRSIRCSPRRRVWVPWRSSSAPGRAPCAANTRRRRLPRSARTPSGSLPATPWRAGWESTHRSDASTTSTRRSCCSASATPRQQQLVSPGRVPRAHTAAPSDGRGRQHVVGPSVDRLRRRRSRRRRLRGPRRRVRCNGSHTQWPRRRGHRPRAPPTRRSRLRRRLAHAPPTLTSPAPPDAPQPQQFMDEAVRSLSTPSGTDAACSSRQAVAGSRWIGLLIDRERWRRLLESVPGRPARHRAGRATHRDHRSWPSPDSATPYKSWAN